MNAGCTRLLRVICRFLSSENGPKQQFLFLDQVNTSTHIFIYHRLTLVFNLKVVTLFTSHLSSHDSNLCSWPGVVCVSSEMFWAHYVIGSSIGLGSEEITKVWIVNSKSNNGITRLFDWHGSDNDKECVLIAQWWVHCRTKLKGYEFKSSPAYVISRILFRFVRIVKKREPKNYFQKGWKFPS